MFGGVATGLVRFDEWIGRRSINEKLTFSQLRIVKDIHGAELAIGVVFYNDADISIEFELESINTRIRNRVPEKRPFYLSRITIPRHGSGWFDDHIIDIGVPPSPGLSRDSSNAKLNTDALEISNTISQLRNR